MSLAEKLVLVAKALGAISKDKTNKHHSYNYVSAEKFIEVVREPMIEQGIMIVPKFTAEWIPQASPKGTPGVAAHLHASYVITDGKESIEAAVVGEGWDSSGDKASYKAMTGAHKYLLRILFNLPMTDDPEADQGHDYHGGSQGHTQRQSAPQGQPRPSQGGPESTDGQRKAIYAIGKSVYGDDFDTVCKPWMKDIWGTDDTRTMTKKQASEVIEELKKLENG